jgi:hypothetical protein
MFPSLLTAQQSLAAHKVHSLADNDDNGVDDASDAVSINKIINILN